MEVGDRQTELRIGPPRTNLPGNYLLSVAAVKWSDGFSLNVPAEESTLEKVPAEAIEDLIGKDSVVPLDKNRDLREAIEGGKHPIDLFPWLLIAVLHAARRRGVRRESLLSACEVGLAMLAAILVGGKIQSVS